MIGRDGTYFKANPGSNFPPPKISSAFFCASSGNRSSNSPALMRRGALETDAYLYLTSKKERVMSVLSMMGMLMSREGEGKREEGRRKNGRRTSRSAGMDKALG